MSTIAPINVIGWLGSTDIRHKIAHYLLALRLEGSVHPATAAMWP
jgi:hypothetical protein